MGCVTEKQRMREQRRIPQSVLKKKSRIQTYEPPKATKIYTGNEMEPVTLNPDERSAFIPTKTIPIQNKITLGKRQDYYDQNNEAIKSKHVLDNKVLTYELDNQNGISKTQQIHTFEYGSVLNHNLNLNQSSIIKKHVQGRA